MRFLHCFIGICGFASAVSAWELNPDDIIKHTGEPVGIEEVHDGGELRSSMQDRTKAYNNLVTMYISRASHTENTTKAVLYLTDAFGLPLLENKL